MEVSCPSGLQGRIRGFKVSEIALLSDRTRTRSGAVLGEIYRDCWLETLDAGPYNFVDKAGAPTKPDWDVVLEGDRLHLLLELRRNTHGDEYEFDLRCEREECGRPIPTMIKLSELEREPLGKSGREHVQTGKPFETVCEGKTVKYRLLVGRDQKFQAQLTEQSAPQRLISIMARRIVEVEGIGTDFRKIRDWLKDVDANEADALQDEMDAVEGGVKTDIQVTCRNCGWDQVQLLPLEIGFFSSRKRFSHSRRAKDGSI